MYTREEYKKRIQELHPVAKELLEKCPDEARRTVSGMCAEDAYIIGMWMGKTLEQITHGGGDAKVVHKTIVLNRLERYRIN